MKRSRPTSEFIGSLFPEAEEPKTNQPVERSLLIPGMRLGTSSFTANGWSGSFYPANVSQRDYLSYYATKFDSVEIDSTFYACPQPSTVTRWYRATPADFVFSLKVPQSITHDKCLVDCDAEVAEFLSRVDMLAEKLGVLLLQFGFFRDTDVSQGEFVMRLRSFFENAKGTPYRFAVEIRNKHWPTSDFAELLREYGAALVLQDQSWMPLPSAIAFDYLTADFTYIRLLGDRKDIEERTKTWDKTVVNRTRELRSWVEVAQHAIKRGEKVYFYVNNHYSGHAPATVAEFVSLWQQTA